ncbi:MAG: hypothetical protein K2O03_09790 [Lachnospiraceae bacterium]|nr:hypothetical protein [Lachnospiraceae bacterium]
MRYSIANENPCASQKPAAHRARPARCGRTARIFIFKANDTPSSSHSGNGRASVDEYYSTEATYRAGVYTCGISLNDTVLSLEIVLDKDHINSLRLVNLEESVATMYPLMEPALNALAEQLMGGIAPENVVLSEETKYTQLLLMEVINQTLEKAALE